MTPSIVFKAITAVVPVLMPVFFIFAMFMLFRIQQTILGYRMDIVHVYELLDILSQGTCSPSAKLIYAITRKSGGIMLTKDKAKVIKEFSMNMFTQFKEQLAVMLEKAKEAEEEEAEKEIQTMIDNVDGVFNLVETVDEKSSPEHMQRVMREIFASVNDISSKIGPGLV